MPHLSGFWETRILWNTVGDWTLAVVAFLATFTFLPLLTKYISLRRRRWHEANTEQPTAVEISTLLIERTSRIFIWSVALFFASSQLVFPHRIERAVEIAIVLIFWYQVGTWAMATVRFAVRRRQPRAGHGPALAGSMEIIIFVAGVLVWTMALMLALDNLGIQIKPLLTGLGIGGIAVALAVQTVLGDLLASMSIALDKPFGIGDALAVDDIAGTVEHIGVKSTRLRSVTGEQIIMSNADVLKSRLRNYGRMRERRSLFQLNVIYDTPPEVLRVIPQEVRRIIESQPNTRFDRCHLLTCGPTALQFEIVYFVTAADFYVYANLQHTINIALLELFRERKMQFATPPLAPTPTIPAAHLDTRSG
jgi:small-conductance mechanosensitive channel